MRKASQSGLFDEELKLEQAIEDFHERKGNAMADERDEVAVELRETNEKLNALLDVLSDGQVGGRRGRRRSREDEPESVRDMDERGRRGEVRQVAFEIKVRVGRDGKTIKGLVFLDGVHVRDDRDLEELGDEVERRFRSANVFSADRFGGGGGFRGNGGGYNGGGGGYGGGWRDRGDWRDRDRRW